MISATTKKYKKKVKQLEDELRYQTRLKDGFREELQKAIGKIELYEDAKSATNSVEGRYREKLEDQVLWLRDLVEKLVVSPEMVKALTTKELRRNEAENLRMRQERKDRDRRDRTLMKINQAEPGIGIYPKNRTGI